MRRESLGLAPFLDALQHRLDALTLGELRQLLLDHAEGLPPAERAGFLTIFDAGTSPPSQGEGGGAEGADPELVADVAAFVDDIAAGVYTDGDAFDPDYGDYRTFGDETWTIEFDHLLDRAGRALLAGDAAQARHAYRVLLAALGQDYDQGGFPGAGAPAELCGSDVDEAKHRYLRAVWESEPLPGRAAALVEAAEDLVYVGGDPTLAALEATRRSSLPDLDEVLADLIVRLQAAEGSDWGFGRQARRLLAEVTERHRGVDGLAELARSPGGGQAQAYCDWVDGLVRAGRIHDAEQAAVEALDQLPTRGAVRAMVAERLAALAVARDDGTRLLDARRAAWRADPTLERLLSLVDVATALDRRAEVLAAEAGQPLEGPLAERGELAAALLLLAHRVDDAVDLLHSAGPLGWSSVHDRHPGPVVVPFLLTGASAAASDDRFADSLLFALIDATNHVGWRYGGPDSQELAAFRTALAADDDRAERGFRAIPCDELLLSALLLDALEAHPPGPAERRRWLDVAREEVTARIDGVVGGQHRGAYQRVAELAVACAEAATLADGRDAGTGFIDGLHARYPRHTAFRRELRAMVAQSPLV